MLLTVTAGFLKLELSLILIHFLTIESRLIIGFLMIIVNGLRKTGDYLFQDTDFIEHGEFLALGDDRPICIPLAIDTEYKQFHYIDHESHVISKTSGIRPATIFAAVPPPD